jgi:hypothetical protein
VPPRGERTTSDWFEAQSRRYQRRLLEAGDPTELRAALSARRDICLARLFDAADELHELHQVPVEDVVRFVRTVLAPHERVVLGENHGPRERGDPTGADQALRENAS